jgi:tRNA G26 N,N-dimethylase Trm1
VSDDEDPVRIAEACSGTGLRQVRIQIDIATAPAIAG